MHPGVCGSPEVVETWLKNGSTMSQYDCSNLHVLQHWLVLYRGDEQVMCLWDKGCVWCWWAIDKEYCCKEREVYILMPGILIRTA